MIKPDIGFVVGRFQVHELHEGHLELFRIVKSRHNRVVVFLGCSKSGPNRHNPLDYVSREKMIHASFPDFTVVPLQDKKTDALWSLELDQRIDDIVGGSPASITLYGSRDSFAPYYHGKHKAVELDIAVPKSINATDIREKLTNTVLSSPDFRAGQIYSAGQRYPQCIPCVDAVIYHSEPDDYSYDSFELLLGRKPGESLWRFVGGHAETSTNSYEDDVKKEVFEETGLSEISNIHYVGSALIDDWRHRGTENKIKTMLFAMRSMTLGAVAADDIEEVKWFKWHDLATDDFEPEHRILFDMFDKWMNSAGEYARGKK